MYSCGPYGSEGRNEHLLGYTDSEAQRINQEWCHARKRAVAVINSLEFHQGLEPSAAAKLKEKQQ
jgi:hypothetical protein